MKNTRRSVRNDYVSASQLAAMGFCEAKIVLEAKHGEKVTTEQQVARDRGNRLHAQFHERAVQNHNSLPRHRTGPCFIATAVYGDQDPRTNELRCFRDQVLQRSPWGRSLISIYYTVSPPIAAWLTKRHWAKCLTQYLLDTIRHIIQSKEGSV